jgi:hypothetical protein
MVSCVQDASNGTYILHTGGAFVTPEGFNPGRDPFSGLKLLRCHSKCKIGGDLEQVGISLERKEKQSAAETCNAAVGFQKAA